MHFYPNSRARFLFLLAVFALILCGIASAAEPAQSDWAKAGPDGKLVYKTTPQGDRLMDFSHAGYMGGGVAIPDVPVKLTVEPSGGDDTAAIQEAVNKVAAMPLENGFHGAVLLAPGTFTCSGPINLSSSGIVVRGSGSGPEGTTTTIKMTGPGHTAFAIGGGRAGGAGKAAKTKAPKAAKGTKKTAKGKAAATATPAPEAGTATPPETPVATPEMEASPAGARTTVTDAYVPAGTDSFTVADASGFAVGDTVAIIRPTTQEWIHFMGMDAITRNGKAAHWLAPGRNENIERKITAISGNKLTFNISFPDSYDAKFVNPPGVTVTKVQPATTVSQIGIEKLHVQCPPLAIAFSKAPYSGARIAGNDCWVRDVFFENTMNTTAESGKRITLERVRVFHTYPNLGGSKPSDFSISSSQILIDRCEITGDNMYFVWTNGLNMGPNVILNSTFQGHGSRIQPHQRWATGLLVDNCTTPDGGIDFPNRGVAGSGHGWTMGWGVAWNCVASFYVIQNPPGSANWAIGCIGDRRLTARYFDTAPILPEGIIDSHGTPVAPQSLYLAQLSDRLGPQSLKNIGYASNEAAMFANKNVPKLPALRGDSDPELGIDLATHRPIYGAPVDTSGQFAAEKAVDGDDDTYWAGKINPAGTAGIEIDTEGPLDINAVVLSEAKGMEGHIQGYKIEGFVDSAYKVLAEGTTVGARKAITFPKVTIWKIRVAITKSNGTPTLRHYGLFNSPKAGGGAVAEAK